MLEEEKFRYGHVSAVSSRPFILFLLQSVLRARGFNGLSHGSKPGNGIELEEICEAITD